MPGRAVLGPVRVAMTTDDDPDAPRPGPVLLHPRLLLGVQPCEDPTPWTGIAWTDVTHPRSASAGDAAAEFYAKVAAAMAQAAPAEGTRCLLYTSPSPRDGLLSRMPSSA